ncbi:alpha/beta hydrolase [Sciscionella marina]|uniref:alpha/beta hydrolase n=1 Tax=Sciscionella marina TaxID=508770 RepID=UPI00036B3755|nr:alpha/beta hydrolase [Sciscionella marina]
MSKRSLWCAVFTALALLPVTALAGRAAPRGIEWGSCPAAVLAPVPAAERARLRCGSFRVSIDHDRPELGGIDIALMKRLADHPRDRIGTLFTNPGGPGNSGFTATTEAYKKYRKPVLDRFDVLGFDPRGVGRSAPLRCFRTAEDKERVLHDFVSSPVTGAQIRADLTARRNYAESCRRNAGPLLYHMSTKDTVRDLDLLRAAVGDAKLDFVGYSYGTLIGASYAAMYPDRTRAIVLDGNVNPLLRTGNGVEHEREHGLGFEDALRAVLARCAASGPRCAFSSGDPAAKFAEIRDHLRHHDLPMPDGSVETLSGFTDRVAEAMWDQKSFPGLMTDLRAIYSVVNGTAVPHGAKTDHARAAAATKPYTEDDSYFGVNCSDKPFPAGNDYVPEAARRWEPEQPTFARWQAFNDAAQCPVWPGARTADRYPGPWHNFGAQPVLTFGNYFDPATPYAFSQRMTWLLGKARLVSVNAYGHTILGGHSRCADRIASDYLVHLRVPPYGTVCAADEQPFGP